MRIPAILGLTVLLTACSSRCGAADPEAAKAILGRWACKDDRKPLVFEKDGVFKYGWEKVKGEWVMVPGTYKIGREKGRDIVRAKVAHKGVTLSVWYHLVKEDDGYTL